MSKPRCPRDGVPLLKTGRKSPPVCLRGGSCEVSACPLSWPANRPPKEIIKAHSEAVEAARKRQALRESGALVVSAWRKRHDKIARRRANQAAREAKRSAAVSVIQTRPDLAPIDPVLDPMRVFARLLGRAR